MGGGIYAKGLFMQVGEASLQEQEFFRISLAERSVLQANHPGHFLKTSTMVSPQFAPPSRLVVPCMTASMIITNTSNSVKIAAHGYIVHGFMQTCSSLYSTLISLGCSMGLD